MFSRVFRCGAAASSSATRQISHNRHGFASSSVTKGGSDLVRDNGYEAGIDFRPVHYLDFEFAYSRSVPLHLNNYSFGMGDRKSTRLNSSHRCISYAVFCLKKKNRDNYISD